MTAGDTAVSENVTVVVLAGGRGTRISSVHPTIPKPLIPINGQPFLYWLTAILATYGPRSFVYSTGHMADQIETWCRDASFPELDRKVCCETEPLGTGGGLLNCLSSISTPWLLVANGDGVCLSGLDELIALSSRHDVQGGLIGVRVDDTSRYGSLMTGDNGFLTEFREKLPGQGYINSGLYLFNRAALSRVARLGASSLERDLIPEMLAQGHRLKVILRDEAPFIDIGTPESLAGAGQFFRDNLPAPVTTRRS